MTLVLGEIKMESILNSIKKMLGITEEYTHFDQDIIIHINSVFVILNQMGVGPDNVFYITDATQTWDQFIDESKLNMVKSYMYLRVRLLFDPPTGSVKDALTAEADELGWRLNVAVDP